MTKNDKKTATGKGSRTRGKKVAYKPSDDIPGFTISSPSGSYISDVHINPHDFAQNYGMQAYCFIEGEHGWKILVSDHVLAQGNEGVMRLLVTDANRRWTWLKEDGQPLGRIPTGLEAELWEATLIMCAVTRTKTPLFVEDIR